MSMKIKTSICNKVFNNGAYRLECKIDWAGQEKVLWITYPEELDHHIDSNSSDWVAIALLAPAMLCKLDIQLAGTISPLLFQFINSDTQLILAAQNKKLQPIKVSCESLQSRKSTDITYSGVGFSAGVDTLSSLAMLDDNEGVRPEYLATFNVGALGKLELAQRMLEKYAIRLQEYSEKYNYRPLIVDSNINEFYEELKFQSTHTLRSAAVVLAMGNAFKVYFYSSTFEYPQISVKETYDISFADPILLPLLSTEATQIRAIGTNLSRLQKVKLVSEYTASFEYLDVCISDAENRLEMIKPNCSKCWKCARQLITLDLLGKLENYKGVFDILYYELQVEELVYQHCITALSPNRPNDSDVIRLAQQKGVISNINFDWLLKISSLSWKIKTIIARVIAKQYSKNRSKLTT